MAPPKGFKHTPESRAKHPFEDTPQFEQVYTNKTGAPMGRTGNGLGDVWGGDGDPEAKHVERSSRPSNEGGLDASPDATEWPEWGVPEILLAMGSLTQRQRFVIECRYGLRPGMDGERVSVREIASLMGITHQGVSKIEAQAVEALRRRLP